MPGQMTAAVDFRDTFLDAQHVAQAFPAAAAVTFLAADGSASSALSAQPPFKLSFTAEPKSAAAASASVSAKGSNELVVAQEYRVGDPGPYPADVPKRNAVRFTPVQVRVLLLFTTILLLVTVLQVVLSQLSLVFLVLWVLMIIPVAPTDCTTAATYCCRAQYLNCIVELLCMSCLQYLLQLFVCYILITVMALLCIGHCAADTD
jgi:Intron-binding protein aquarius N-terminus